MSRIETDSIPLEEREVDVDHMIASCVRLVGERAERADLTLAIEVSKDLPVLVADERRVKQILLNLLTNAIKFTAAGGTVTLRAGMDKDSRFVFAVSDTGRGISLENLDLVMLPFHQVEGSYSRSHDGAGLGLPLCKALADLHGAGLTLESMLGVGTTVTLAFPPERTVKI